MSSATTTLSFVLVPSPETAWQDVDSSFARFCLTAGIEAIEPKLCYDNQQLAAKPLSRGDDRGQRWGLTKGIGFHGDKVTVRRPRVGSSDGHELALATWTAVHAEDWLGRWAINLMLINVSTRKRRAVRLPEGDLPTLAGDGTSKSAASRRFVALADRLVEWMSSHMSESDAPVIRIDGLHIGNDLVLVAALGIDADGRKHPLAVVEGATENAAVLQALINNLVECGVDPKLCRLFLDGDKARSKIIRWTFGAHTPFRGCNVTERLPKAAARFSPPTAATGLRYSRAADRHPPQTANAAAALARLQQRDREHDGDSVSRLSQRGSSSIQVRHPMLNTTLTPPSTSTATPASSTSTKCGATPTPMSREIQ